MKITKIRNRNIMFTVPECVDGIVNMAVILGTKHNFIIDIGIGIANVPEKREWQFFKFSGFKLNLKMKTITILKYACYSDCVKAMLEYIGDDPKPIIVINTHGDWDHAAGNWVLEENVIISHVLGRERLDKRWDESIKRAKENDRYFEGEVRKCLPNMVFEGNLHFPEDGISLFHTPGHTEGCISIYDAVDKVLHAGDSFGASDGKAYFWGQELIDFQRLVEAYKKCDFEVCISGHSEPQTKELMGFFEVALAEAIKESKKTEE
ncbi:MAG: MBL fold metallo-hydrolase [Defluviitaleaceae bacterium]|nr:MBL fold metallo-hydrolase [Defluviitaleaceae bacterium]